MQICTRCNIEKSIDEFHKNKRNKSGYMNQCKTCINTANLKWYYANIERSRINSNGWEAHNKDKRRSYKLKSRYGIDSKIYDELKEKQGFKCAICSKTETNLFVDHCHNKGHVRGLLCKECNLGLGMFFDNIDNLNNAIEYLKKKS
jgi:hypothetical protein